MTQISLRSELLSQIRGSDVVRRDQIHRNSRITQYIYSLRNKARLIGFKEVNELVSKVIGQLA